VCEAQFLYFHFTKLFSQLSTIFKSACGRLTSSECDTPLYPMYQLCQCILPYKKWSEPRQCHNSEEGLSLLPQTNKTDNDDDDDDDDCQLV